MAPLSSTKKKEKENEQRETDERACIWMALTDTEFIERLMFSTAEERDVFSFTCQGATDPALSERLQRLSLALLSAATFGANAARKALDQFHPK
jgi:hypothetical protein